MIQSSDILIARFNEHVDPHLHVWGWEVPVYLFLGGVTAGLMILAALRGLSRAEGEPSRALRWLPFAAPVLLSLGMGALFLDLEHKLHVYRFYLSFQVASPMSWGSWILLAVYPAVLALGLLGITRAELEWLTARLPAPLARLLAATHGLVREHAAAVRWANVALGAGLGVYTGVLLGTLGARAAWASALLGPLFLVSGLSTGAAFMMLWKVSHAEHRFLLRWDVGAIVVELALLGLYLVGLATAGGHTGQEALALFLGGPYTAPFWALVVITGLGVPLFLEAWEAVTRSRPVAAAPALVLVGGLALRWVLVAAGQG